jgi:FkbM family methyltransferase
MTNLSERSAVFVGCARNCGMYLNQVLANVERIAALYRQCAFVFVENDSSDDSKTKLLAWLSSHPSGALLELDGLAAEEPRRTVRLALARNSYLGYLESSPYANYDDLVVFDFDEVNASRLEPVEFAAAAGFLHSDERTVGVFANSQPVYFDIWALRHATWCPDNCWLEVRRAQDVSKAEAVERLVFARQIPIDPLRPPIQVASAFGGLGIYRLARTLPHRHVGSTPDGEEICEHVSLNLALSRDGNLYIFPRLQNRAPAEHLRPSTTPCRQLRLEQDGKHCVLLAPLEHRLDTYRAASPLYDRRLPLLSRLIAESRETASIIDVGANIGDTVALCRMAGCQAPFIAIEPSEQYFAFLEANRNALPEMFGNVRTLRAFIGRGNERLSILEHAGTARSRGIEAAAGSTGENAPCTLSLDRVTDLDVSLIKVDTDGYDSEILSGSIEFLRRIRPVIWAEAEVNNAADVQSWSQLCADLAESHPLICIFDNFGFLITSGAVRDKQATLMDLLVYTRRQRTSRTKNMPAPTIYYVDVVFFPVSQTRVYESFVNALKESAF